MKRATSALLAFLLIALAPGLEATTLAASIVGPQGMPVTGAPIVPVPLSLGPLLSAQCSHPASPHHRPDRPRHHALDRPDSPAPALRSF